VTLALLLKDPQRIKALAAEQWDQVIPQARRAGLLSRLAAAAMEQDFYALLPERPRLHLQSARLLAEKHRRDVLYELDRIKEIIGKLVGTIVLLKGAAYLAAELPAGQGRVFSDIDILVPEEKIGAVEALLQLAGWRLGEIDPYDDGYYRRWMHQIPPLTHIGRQTTIDVHHSLVPRTARIGAVPAAPLLKRTRELPQRPGFAVLAPEDMILHSATHLFNEGEFGNGLRDLTDLDLLIRHFGADAGFWPTLLTRARELGLTRPLYYALRYIAEIAGTPVPSEIGEATRRFAPSFPASWLMDAMLRRALAPSHRSSQDAWTGSALFLLYVRAHYLRMPLRLLVPHLIRKAFRRHPKSNDKQPA